MERRSELDKCMAGEIYDCHDGVFLEFKNTARALLARYNALAYDQKDEKREILERLLGSIGSNVSVGLPFICDYGRNIHLGTNVTVNMNCTFVDCNTITVGDDTMISSSVQLYTSTHPVEAADRLVDGWDPGSGRYRWNTYAKPISIGDRCWLGGGVIVLPGITIGDGSVVGAGSVVTRDVPPDCVVAGNPARVIRRINQSGGRTEA